MSSRRGDLYRPAHFELSAHIGKIQIDRKSQFIEQGLGINMHRFELIFGIEFIFGFAVQEMNDVHQIVESIHLKTIDYRRFVCILGREDESFESCLACAQSDG